tara:strand:+ start:23298 stop:23663 length:366 start_codon:yes stop_codon:yes gene_type:complete
MSEYPEIQIGRERNEDGQMMVRVGGALCGTVEGLKEMIDGEVEREILRKLRAAGVTLTLEGGEPRVRVPASVASLVKIEGKPSAFTVVADQFVVTDGFAIDPHFARRVETVVRDAQKRRAL